MGTASAFNGKPEIMRTIDSDSVGHFLRSYSCFDRNLALISHGLATHEITWTASG